MPNFFSKNKKVVILALIVAFAFVLSPLPTRANVVGEFLGGFAAEGILLVSNVISSILSAFFGMLISIEAKIIDYLLSPTTFSFTHAKIVTLGWGISRDLANMFFILILLMIAFSTVLRIESFAMKRLMPKLIIAALLINFSLVVAGVIIDFSQILTSFFIKNAVGGGGSITEHLASAMKITNFYKPSAVISGTGVGVGQGITEFTSAAVAATVGVILTLIGLVITVFVFGATAIFLVYRVVNIWFLLIFLPLAIVAAVFPPTSGHFKKWWDKFFSWVFFAPAYAFMIYLSLSIFTAAGEFGAGTFGNAVQPDGWNTAAASSLTTASLPSAIFQWIVVIAIMFYSLIVAKKFGVDGAETAHKTLTGWSQGAKNWAGRTLRRGAVAATQPLPAGAPAPTGVRGIIRRYGGAALGRIAVATPGARGAYLSMLSDEEKAYSGALGQYKNIDPAILEQILRGPLEPHARLAIQQTLIENKKFKPTASQLIPMLNQAQRYNKQGDLLKIVADKMGSDLTFANGYTDEQRKELMTRAKTQGVDKELSKLMPVIAAQVLKKPEEAIEDKIKDIVSKMDKATDILEDQLTAEVVRAFSAEQLKSLMKSPSREKREKTAGAILDDFNSLSDADKLAIRKVTVTPNKNQQETARNSLKSNTPGKSDEDIKVLSRKHGIITAPGFEL